MTERRRGTTTLVRRPIPWWVWLLVAGIIALLILAVLWPLLAGNDRGGTAATASPPATSPDGSPEEVADVLLIIDAPDPGSLVGTPVALTGAEVQSVVGDATFWVGPSTDQQVLVVLEEDPSAGPIEGQVDVEEGQTVSIAGIVREMPTIDEAMERWQLSEDAAAQLEGEVVFIRAQRVGTEE